MISWRGLSRPTAFLPCGVFPERNRSIDEYIVGYANYAGLGSGSIGYMDGTCYANTFDIEEYISRVEAGEIPVMASKKFGLKEQVRYEFLMSIFGMGVDLKVFRERFGSGVS